jgi:RNA polymerase sigma factor for flagellar operon FliA
LYNSTRDDDAALINKYAGLIDRVARRLTQRVGIPSTFDDLWSAGALGLLDAAKRFDSARDVRFESFVEHRVRGAMLDELRKMDHLPRRLRTQADQISKTRQALAHKLGHEPSIEELAAELNMDVGELGEMEMLAMPHMPLAQNFPTCCEDVAQDEQLAKAECLHALTSALASLPERLQILMSLHYVEGLTYKEIAQVFEVSEPRVCQLHAEAVNRIRDQMSDGAEQQPKDKKSESPTEIQLPLQASLPGKSKGRGKRLSSS